jgi:hypothetical protein
VHRDDTVEQGLHSGQIGSFHADITRIIDTVITLLLGLRIMIGVLVVCWLMTGAVMVVKWVVLPVSVIAMCGWVKLRMGGPMVLMFGDEAAIKQLVGFKDVATKALSALPLKNRKIEVRVRTE